MQSYCCLLSQIVVMNVMSLLTTDQYGEVRWCHGARVAVHKMSLSRRVVRSSCCVYSTFCLLWLVQRNVLMTLLKIVVSINIT